MELNIFLRPARETKIVSRVDVSWLSSVADDWTDTENRAVAIRNSCNENKFDSIESQRRSVLTRNLSKVDVLVDDALIAELDGDSVMALKAEELNHQVVRQFAQRHEALDSWLSWQWLRIAEWHSYNGHSFQAIVENAVFATFQYSFNLDVKELRLSRNDFFQMAQPEVNQFGNLKLQWKA